MPRQENATSKQQANAVLLTRPSAGTSASITPTHEVKPIGGATGSTTTTRVLHQEGQPAPLPVQRNTLYEALTLEGENKDQDQHHQHSDKYGKIGNCSLNVAPVDREQLHQDSNTLKHVEEGEVMEVDGWATSRCKTSLSNRQPEVSVNGVLSSAIPKGLARKVRMELDRHTEKSEELFTSANQMASATASEEWAQQVASTPLHLPHAWIM